VGTLGKGERKSLDRSRLQEGGPKRAKATLATRKRRIQKTKGKKEGRHDAKEKIPSLREKGEAPATGLLRRRKDPGYDKARDR